MFATTKAYENTVRDQEQDQLILDHLEFVRQVLGRLAVRLPNQCDTENLESAGVLGLIEAARNYDPQRGVAFTTYAYPRIHGAILDELRRNCPLSQTMLQSIARVRQAYESLPSPVSLEQLADAADLTVEQVSECLHSIRLANPEPWNDLHCTIHATWDHGSEAPSDAIEMEEAKQVLADGIERLPERERIVITLYHVEDLRLKEIGEVLSLSESRVSRILSQAEFRLKEYVRSRLAL